MTQLASLLQPDKGQTAVPLVLVDKKGFDAWLNGEPQRVRNALSAQGFRGDGYQIAFVPGDRDEWSAVLGVANVNDLSPWCLAKAAETLPEGTYRVAGKSPGPAVLGWLLGQYRFGRYKEDKARKGARVLLTDVPAAMDEAVAVAAGRSVRSTRAPFLALSSL